MAGNPPAAGAPPNMRADAMSIGAQNGSPNPKDMLPTFIYDYLIKEREYGLAQAMLSSNLGVQTQPKTSPEDVNGVDDESKDELQKRLDSLPRPRVQEQLPDTAFLKDWWSLFWDLWSASRGKTTSPIAVQYFQASQSSARQQSQARQSMMQQGMMPNANMNLMNMRMQAGGNMRNGVMDMRQTAIANSRPGMRPQMNLQQQPGQGQMQREGSDMDLNGQRAQSPMSGGDNEPSPKRPRTDGGPQMAGRPNMQMPNGVPVTNPMMQAGFDTSLMNGAQFPGGPNGKQMPVFGMGKPGMPGQVPQGSPMMGPNGEMPTGADMVAFQSGMPRGPMQGGNNQQGGALADYQMQLMLLEQQNKKRLLMARQEQDVMSHAGGAPGTGPGAGPGVPGGPLMGGGPGGLMTAPGMSPHGSRTGHSPNNDQMKRGTPKMGQSSPLPDGSMPGRGSPGPGFDGGMPHNMAGNPMFMGNKMVEAQMGPGGNMMRPPNGMPGGFMGPNGTPMTPQQMEMMTRNGGRMPSGSWPGGPQMQGGQLMPGGPQQPPQLSQGDNGQRAQMPPPSAPPGNNGRTQPSSPQGAGAAAPPTPSQANKAAPKKKDTKDSKKKGGQKKGTATTGAIPSTEPAEPPTPTPSTPIIPVHPNSFTGTKAQAGSANAQSQAPAAPQPAAIAPAADNTATAGPFGNIDPTNDMGMGAFDFQNADNSDVLDGFDFDSFLHMDEAMPFNDFDPSQYALNTDGVEMGTTDP